MAKVRGEFTVSLRLALLPVLLSCRAFYLPGVVPCDFHKSSSPGAPLDLAPSSPSLAMAKARGEFAASLLLALLLVLPSCRAFYLHSVAPHDFHKVSSSLHLNTLFAMAPSEALDR